MSLTRKKPRKPKNGLIFETDTKTRLVVSHEQLDMGFAELQGHRPEQEDRVVIGKCEGRQFTYDAWRQVLMKVTSTLETNVEEKPYAKNEGSCLLANIIVANRVYTANLGDSTAFVVVVGKNKGFTRLNNLHNPSNVSEAKYIKSREGLIFRGRLFGSIAVSRAIGDTEYGAHMNHRAEISEYVLPTLGTGEQAFLITACDGLTESNFIVGDDISKIVHMNQHRPASEIAAALADAAHKAGSTDNISVIVTPINPNNTTPRFAAVFDGHGGDKVAEYLYQHFIETLDKEINNKLQNKPFYYDASRFQNNKGIVEEDFSYNSNQIGPVVVCEGPHPVDLNHVVSFLENLKARGITHHISAGNPMDGRDTNKGFFDLLNAAECQGLVNRGYEINVINLDNTFNSTHVKLHKISIKNTVDGSVHDVNFLAFPSWGDFSAGNFDENAVRTLHAFYLSADLMDYKLGVNCTAGLGRSGVIALAFDLYQVPDANLDGEMTPELMKIIKQRLKEMRNIRPGLIQTDPQFYMAIALGMQMRRLKSEIALGDLNTLIQSAKRADEALFLMPEPAPAPVVAVSVPIAELPNDIVTLLNNLQHIINNDLFWRSKTHLSSKPAPDGILELRRQLSDLLAKNQNKGVSSHDALNCIANVAKARLNDTKGIMHLFFGGAANLTRDKSTTQFYELCSDLLKLKKNIDKNDADALGKFKANAAYVAFQNEYKKFGSPGNSTKPRA